MNIILSLLLPVLLLAAAVSGTAESTVGYTLSSATGYTSVATSNSSVLYHAQLYKASPYTRPIEVVVLQGSREQLGYDYGVLTGKGGSENFHALFASLLGSSGAVLALESAALSRVLLWQWDAYLSLQVPSEYLREIGAIGAGGASVGFAAYGETVKTGIVLANLPSDEDDILAIFEDELHKGVWGEVERRVIGKLARWGGIHCSMAAAWGGLTDKQQLFSMRNLDWQSNTGVNAHKQIVVFKPDDGKIAHATMGFAGLYGALAGQSVEGLTAHEANLEEPDSTMLGFPFVLRLRWVMENARTSAEAATLMHSTNNTSGFNHMFTSAVDAAAGNPPAVAFETRNGYTATFRAADPREDGATYEDKNTGQQVQFGYTMQDALYRTNHGYDPTIRAGYKWKYESGAGADSVLRYELIHSGIEFYKNQGKAIDAADFINVTATVGTKGKGDDYHKCIPAEYSHGNNVLSVTYAPSVGVFWAAWEANQGDDWVPACCGQYIMFDLSQFWGQPSSARSRIAQK